MIRLFNSLGRRKEVFTPHKKTVTMYVCGITPDGTSHLGHAFVFTAFDVLVRYLEHLGYAVRYAQNLTDIDDDILARSKKAGKNWRAFGEENAHAFLEDMKWLNNQQPDFYPRATDHIAEMIAVIQKLLKKGVAYERNGSVYFSIEKDKNYGTLSSLTKEEMLETANERGNDPNDSNKDNPLDFILWQAKKNGEPSWPSPWGAGRPGWHIECSAMAMKYLGVTLDIHGGGGDLVFPHHESEITQSENATGKRFAKFWMHVGMLRYQGEKMSKSLGNLVLIRDLRKKYSANVVRILLLSHQYRSVWEYEEKEFEKAQELEGLLKDAWKTPVVKESSPDVDSFQDAFYTAMSDDLNTPKALKALKAFAQCIIQEGCATSGAKAFLTTASNILGLRIGYM